MGPELLRKKRTGAARSASFLAWASLLVFAFAGGLYSTDVQAQLEVSGSLIGQRPLLTAEHGWLVQGRNGLEYAPHGIGYSLMLLPAALCGAALG
ncbi:hypothetical protein JW921_05275, partial [Candidatus Fermentibacterales bacterium]|nr:hypothetical protein [Candidatus Fermentibacterales bacterium]